VDGGARSFHHRRIAAEVISMGVGGEDSRDFSAKLLTHDLERFFRARFIEPGVDEDDLAIVAGKDPDVDASGDDP
jgi:hypothetical protein